MNPDKTAVNETGPIFYNGEQVEQPGTSSSNSMESSGLILLTMPECQELIDFLLKTDNTLNSTLCNGPCPCGQCHIFQSLPSFPNDSIPCNYVFPSTADTERDLGSSPSTVSPVSTYSCPTMPLTSEDALEGAESAIDNNSVNCINVSNSENSVLPEELSKPGCTRTCTGCVRPASACHDAHRLTASEDAIKKEKFFKGVNKKKNSDKWTCEIRISKKLLQDCKLKAKAKLWLGTFDTRCQAARALHLGRFLLSEKKIPETGATNFEKSFQTLSEFKDRMREKPLDAQLLRTVKKLAIEYGKNGSLASSISSLGADLGVSPA